MKKAFPYIIVIIAGIAALIFQHSMKEFRQQRKFEKEMKVALEEIPRLMEDRLEDEYYIDTADVYISVDESRHLYDEFLFVECTLTDGFESDRVEARAEMLHTIMECVDNGRKSIYTRWNRFGDVALGIDRSIGKDYEYSICISIEDNGFTYDYYSWNGERNDYFYVYNYDEDFEFTDVPFGKNFESLLECEECGSIIDYVEKGCLNHSDEEEIQEELEEDELIQIDEELDDDFEEDEIESEPERVIEEDAADVADNEEPAKTEEKPVEKPVEEPEEEIIIDATGVTPEVKEALDSIEDVFDEYIDFVKTYSFTSSNSDSFAKYSEIMMKYLQAMNKLEKMGDAEMTARDFEYYMAVVNKLNKKILRIGK